jgi:hypothetical protein
MYSCRYIEQIALSAKGKGERARSYREGEREREGERGGEGKGERAQIN